MIRITNIIFGNHLVSIAYNVLQIAEGGEYEALNLI